MFDEVSDAAFAGLRVDADDRLGGLTEAMLDTSNLHPYCLLGQKQGIRLFPPGLLCPPRVHPCRHLHHCQLAKPRRSYFHRRIVRSRLEAEFPQNPIISDAGTPLYL